MGFAWPGRVRSHLVSFLAGGCSLALVLVAAWPAGSVAAMSPGGIQLTQSGGTMTESASLFVGNPGDNLGVSVSGNARVTYASGPAQITMVGSPRNVGGSEGVFNSFMGIGFSSPGTYVFNASGLVEGTNTVTFTVAISYPPQASPTPSPAANDSGWNSGDVTVNWNWTDAGGGIINPGACAPTSTASGQGSVTVTASCANVDGNVGQASYTANIDSVAPSVALSGFQPDGANGWFKTSPATGTVTAGDATSGVASIDCTDNGSPLTVGTDGALSVTGDGTHAVSCTATDVAGNTSGAATTTIRVDTAMPTITAAAATADGRAYSPGTWTRQPVTVSFACTDGGPDTVTCSQPVTVSQDGKDQSVTGTATDQAGNTASATVSGIDIDTTAPTVTYSVATGTTYTVDQQVTITCAASDALSGIASSTCADISGPAYTFGVGTHSYSATATDNAGNSATASISFTVANSTTSLGNLVTQFTASAPAGTASSLNSKLQGATVATNSTSRNNQLNAFIHEVQAQSGKKLTASQADTLIGLAQALEAQ